MRLVVLLLAATLAAPGLAFEISGQRWKEPTASFYINIPGESPTGGTWKAALIRAMNAWSDATEFQFVAVDEYLDPCSGGFGDNSTNSVDFGYTICGTEFGQSVLAITLTSYSEFIIDSDIIFNNILNWDVYNGPRRFTAEDFERVALHEFGHALGLGHEMSRSAIMQPLTSDIYTLQQDDINGANYIYGSALPTVNICDRTPQVEAAILAAINPTPACEAVLEADLAGIRSLNLSEDGITSLASGDFTGLSALEVLSLTDNALTTLPAGVFDGLSALEWLNLYGNALTTLSAGVFDGLSALEVLLLDSNALTTLPAGVFDRLSALERLDLGFNALTTLPAGVFDGLSVLENLDLSGNNFTTLPAGVFDDVLDTLGPIGSTFIVDDIVRRAHFVCSLADADTIVALTAGVDDCLRITFAQLTVYQNSVNICDRTPQVEAEILAVINPTPACGAVPTADLAAIRGLYLREAGITSLASGDFTGLSALEYLRLDRNALTSLPAGVFDGLSALEWLVLDGNDFTTLPDGVFDSLSALRFLGLSDNDDLTTLPPDIFDDLSALEGLYLNSNDLSTLLPDVFDGLRSLSTLDLSGNDFTTLPASVFDGLSALEWLVLDGNDFTTLPAGVESLSALERLELGGNALTTLPAGVFDRLSALERLDLRWQ